MRRGIPAGERAVEPPGATGAGAAAGRGDSLPPELEAWRRQGRLVEVFGRRVFVREAGPPGAPTLLVLHGYPSSSYDFHRSLDRLAASHRVILHDHLGFGLSEKPADYSYSLIEQAEVALGLWKVLRIERGHLVAHDYGTSVATELLARRERGGLPVELVSVTLSNGSVHLELARLRLSQRLLRSRVSGPLLARLATRGYFESRMRRLWSDPEGADRRDLEVLWAGLVLGGGRARLPRVTSYLGERVRFRHRWIGALCRSGLPIHILWGRQDPVAVAAIAQRLAGEVPGARLTWLEGAGHYPMLEVPEAWAEEVLAFAAGVEG